MQDHAGKFPRQGLLQFWILNDDVSGLNFDDITLQDTFGCFSRTGPDSHRERNLRENAGLSQMRRIISGRAAMAGILGRCGYHFFR
ncbi:MAG: DUF1963 domain-containing protein [Ruminococcus sp.]